MSRRLRITDEVREWLTELRTHDLPAAQCVGEAVVVLLNESPGPPLVVPVDPLAWSDDPQTALGHAYQRQLGLLQKVRRAVADIATQRKRAELNLQQLESGTRRLGDHTRMADEAGRHDLAQDARERQVVAQETLAELRRSYAELLREEEQAVRAERRLRQRTDDWRARKEQVRAAYLIAQAQDTIDEALAMAGEPHVAGDPAPHTAAARSAVEEFLDTTRTSERDHDLTPLDLRELRLGALTGHDLRVLFAVEPSGAILLLAAGQASVAWHDQGISIPGDLREDPDEEDDTQASFLREFFPGEEEERQAGAARLLALGRVRVLADVRRRLGLAQEQVAERMNATTEQVAAIEGAGATDVGALAAYVAAIGGRLEIVADLGTERVRLR